MRERERESTYEMLMKSLQETKQQYILLHYFLGFVQGGRNLVFS